MHARRFHRLLPLLGLLSLAAPVAAQAKSPTLRGYTVMAGALGREPRGPGEMWFNTTKAHLEFIDRAHINLVAIELPYGLSERHPKSDVVARFVAELRQRKVAVWLLYPHALAQAFDLPRQVGSDGKRIDWNCCFDSPEVQDWLCDNGVSLVQAYRADALLLFGTFHQGGQCHCDSCRQAKVKSAVSQERFFVRLRTAIAAAQPGTRLGTCDFWAQPTKPTLQAIDMLSPVVPIFRPGYADASQVQQKLAPLRSQSQDEQVVPYVKLFLASQTNSTTADVIGALQQCRTRADGFLLWGYNPGHS